MNKVVKRIISGFVIGYVGLSAARETEERIRSTILVRIPQLITWSESNDFNQPEISYRLCIYRDRTYFNFIRDYLGDDEATVKGQPITLSFTRKLSDLANWHVSYVGDISTQGIARIVETGLLKDTIVVASSEQSAERGLHVRLFVGSAQTIDIELNQAAFMAHGSAPRVSFLKHVNKVYDKPTQEKL